VRELNEELERREHEVLIGVGHELRAKRAEEDRDVEGQRPAALQAGAALVDGRERERRLAARERGEVESGVRVHCRTSQR